MSSVTATRVAVPPAWPMAMLAFFVTMATLSLAQGFVDVVVPVARGATPFAFLFSMTQAWGPAFLGGYVFLHNLGLACVVPGFGFLAARFEKKPANRGLIGMLLAGSVVASLLVALELIFQASERFDVPTALAIFAAEASAVLALALAAARELRGFVPTPRVEWSLVTPFRRLRLPLAYAVTTLLVVSLLETWILLG